MNFKYKKGVKTVSVLLYMLTFFMPSLLLSENSKTLAVFYELTGDSAEARYNKVVEEKLPTIGFNLADPHKRVNDQYKTKYGSTTLDVLSFMPVVNDANVMPLFNIDPRLAGFSPFNMLIHKKLEEDITHVGHLTPEAILDILGIEDKALSKKFIDSFKPLDDLLDKEFGEKKTYTTYTNLSKDNMLNFEYTFERPEDMDDFIDEFQNKFEMSFIDKEYLIAGFHDFLSTDEGEEALDGFDIFWAYSLCHLEYSYNMFDNTGARPDAGLFAPCTMYMYVKKGTNTLVVGMPKLINIMDTLGVKESSRVALVNKLDKEIPEILTAFGMTAVKDEVLVKVSDDVKVLASKIKEEMIMQNKEEKSISIVLPAVPMPPKALILKEENDSSSSVLEDRSIKFSKRTPANYITSSERYGADGKLKIKKVNSKIGEVDKGRISAFLRADLMDISTATQKLKNAGFNILATFPLDKKKKLISIVFTNSELQEMASKNNRGYMATLRLLIDPKNNQISITNPLYLGKALLQEEYNEDASKKVLASILNEFSGLRNSLDKLKYSLLPNYQFMDGMPYFKDMEVIARGDDLLSKLKRKKSKKKVVFTLTLKNGATLVGIKLSKRTRKFPKRIGSKNAGMLPYPILIENGEAKILEPKYYLALMYPQLSMEEFMTIATIPGAIIKDCTKVFR